MVSLPENGWETEIIGSGRSGRRKKSRRKRSKKPSRIQLVAPRTVSLPSRPRRHHRRKPFAERGRTLRSSGLLPPVESPQSRGERRRDMGLRHTLLHRYERTGELYDHIAALNTVELEDLADEFGVTRVSETHTRHRLPSTSYSGIFQTWLFHEEESDKYLRRQEAEKARNQRRREGERVLSATVRDEVLLRHTHRRTKSSSSASSSSTTQGVSEEVLRRIGHRLRSRKVLFGVPKPVDDFMSGDASTYEEQSKPTEQVELDDEVDSKVDDEESVDKDEGVEVEEVEDVDDEEEDIEAILREAERETRRQAGMDEVVDEEEVDVTDGIGVVVAADDSVVDEGLSEDERENGHGGIEVGVESAMGSPASSLPPPPVLKHDGDGDGDGDGEGEGEDDEENWQRLLLGAPPSPPARKKSRKKMKKKAEGDRKEEGGGDDEALAKLKEKYDSKERAQHVAEQHSDEESSSAVREKEKGMGKKRPSAVFAGALATLAQGSEMSQSFIMNSEDDVEDSEEDEDSLSRE